VVSILPRNDGQLIVGLSGVRVYLGGEAIVPLRGSPIAVLLDEFGFAVAGEVAELDQRLVAGCKDLVLQGGGDALAQGRLGSWTQ